MDWSNPLIYIVLGLALAGALWKLGNWMGTKDQFAKTVGEAIEEIREDIKKIFQELPKKVDSDTSPLRLTDLGKSISAFLDAATWAEQTAQKAVTGIPEEEKHPYGIQTYCFEFVKRPDTLSDQLNRKVQEAAYNNGLEVDTVKRVLALELRDLLLRRYGLEPPESSQ